MPGTLVRMVLYGPRYSMGALGFMSHVSTWLGPPQSRMKMQFLSDETALPPLSSWSVPNTEPGIPMLATPKPPATNA